MTEYYTDDITWCSNRKCNKKCDRNPKLIKFTPVKEYSFADLDGTVYCAKKKGENNDFQRETED